MNRPLAAAAALAVVAAIAAWIVRPGDAEPTPATAAAATPPQQASASTAASHKVRAPATALPAASHASAPATARRDIGDRKDVGVLGRRIADIYEQSLQSNRPHDNLLAMRLFFDCFGINAMHETYKETGLKGEGWDEYIPQQEQHAAVVKALNDAVRYCNAYQGGEYPVRVRKAGRRLDPGYSPLISRGRAYTERFAAVVQVLNFPAANPLEFTLWLDTDLDFILHKRFDLRSAQVHHAQLIVFTGVVGEPAIRRYYAQYLCAARFFCEGIPQLTEPERLAAERAALAIEQLIAQQRWDQLIAPAR